MRCILTVGLLALAQPATAQEWQSVTPVFSQIVAYALPEQFVPAFEAPEPASYLQEAVLQGETVDDWTQIITMTGTRGGVRPDDSGGTLAFANTLAESYAQSCPNSFQAHEMRAVTVPGARATFAALIGCGQIEDGSGLAEGAVILFLAGKDDIYTLQWAERFDATSGPHHFAPRDWQARLDHLAAGARLCDPVPGEGPPYPSCSGS